MQYAICIFLVNLHLSNVLENVPNEMLALDDGMGRQLETGYLNKPELRS